MKEGEVVIEGLGVTTEIGVTNGAALPQVLAATIVMFPVTGEGKLITAWVVPCPDTKVAPEGTDQV